MGQRSTKLPSSFAEGAVLMLSDAISDRARRLAGELGGQFVPPDQAYSVVIQSDGKIKLYDTEEHAKAAPSTGVGTTPARLT